MENISFATEAAKELTKRSECIVRMCKAIERVEKADSKFAEDFYGELILNELENVQFLTLRLTEFVAAAFGTEIISEDKNGGTEESDATPRGGEALNAPQTS